MRNAAVLSIVLLAVVAFSPPATANVGGGCVRTYAQGYAHGTYVFTSTNGAIGVGFEVDLVGGGAAVFVVVQPSNCGNVEPPSLNDIAGSKGGLEPMRMPDLVMP